MKAILMNAPGEPEVLQAGELPLPELPSPAHLLVRLHAAGVNPIDTKLRKNGTYFPDNLPTVLGCDGAGMVENIGNAVTRFKPGDEVYFFNGGIGSEQGCYAEYTVIHEDYVAAKPKTLSMAEAAALPMVLITAWEALHDRVQLRAGQTVLIHAAAGGVGHVAVQIAKEMGVRVAATVSSEAKAAWVRKLGAEKIIYYTSEDFVQTALDWTDGQGVDAIFDTVGGDTFCRSFAAARVYGKIVTLLQTDCAAGLVKLARLRNQSIHYELMLTPAYLGLHQARIAQTRILESGAQLIEAGRLKVEVSKTFPLEQAAEAHRLIEEGHSTGKIVLCID
ncbi:alcohol dehydrogenase zinc-binding domain protein [Sulfuricella denitrificans skB26]|uniref:Alcohol dehydrogenase zinc-binding domain protein n=1 Tax=Sulfuricella denitrificans (strain DSM 22764 / NBRC 105220 / skB26) TaxID=1163617 RepID=S6AFN1_SULDS|nr:zinc-dependent alcohol dehydrogenase family protein [Sulfuricella denitrificans]BAN34701.1 alcohol dehydrogenase zinc-binding domain protein [Sulfuricella denitrificans skB26]